MPWAKLDDQLPTHPKMAEAGTLAQLLYLNSLAYSSRYLTDGFIPIAVVRQLVTWDFEPAPDNYTLAQRLVDAKAGREFGLWEVVDGGYLIHDYLEYNPSREQVLAEREKAKKRVTEAREAKKNRRSPDVREVFARSSPEQQPKFGESSDCPVPVPVPEEREVVVDRPREPVEITQAAAAREIIAGWHEVTATDVPPAILHRLLKAAADGFEHALLRELGRRCAAPTTRRSAPFLDQILSDCKRLGTLTLDAFAASEAETRARGAPAADRPPERPKFLNGFV